MNPSPHDQVDEARARAAQALRDLSHAFVAHDAPAELLDRAAHTLASLTTDLAEGPQRPRIMRRRGEDPALPQTETGVMTTFDDRPFSGRSSPWGLDMTVRRDGDEVEATCTLKAAHEGAPGRSHGGVVAALFDDLFGFVVTVLAIPAVTGELTVRYHHAIPLGRPLVCRARCSERTGRRLLLTAELCDEDLVVARSSAVFIAIDPAKVGFGGP